MICFSLSPRHPCHQFSVQIWNLPHPTVFVIVRWGCQTCILHIHKLPYFSPILAFLGQTLPLRQKVRMKWNAVCPTLTLNEQWPAAWQPGWMAQGSHSFTCNSHVYPRMEFFFLHSCRKHSPDGAAWARQHTSGSAYYSVYRPRKYERLSWPSWLTV